MQPDCPDTSSVMQSSARNAKSRRLGLSSLERKSLTEVVFSREVYASLCSLTQSIACEVSGLLYGHFDFETAMLHVTSWQICTGAVQTETECVIDIDELLFLSTLPRKGGERFVGIFHSHVKGEPVPSLVDHYLLRFSPFIWTITGYSSQSCTPAIRNYAAVSGCVKEIRGGISASE
jgi:proteasome lid subunit RPN8/RPN11